MANRSLLLLRDIIKAERPEIIGHSNFPELFLTRLVNDGQKYVQVQLAHLGIKQWEATDSLTLSAGTLAEKSVKTSPLATDCPSRLFEGRDAVKYVECTGVLNSGIASYVDDDVFLELLRNSYLTPTEKEPKFTRKNNLLIIAPSTIIAAIGVYYKSVTDLSADGDLTTIPENYEDFIVKRALIDVDGILQKLGSKSEAINQLTKDIRDTYQSFGFVEAKEPNKVTLQ